MTRTVTVHGFGSAFDERKDGDDIDLLIVHHGSDLASCKFAISCKMWLLDSVARAHVTMLSDTEEAYCEFIKTAGAMYLGTIREDQFEGALAALEATLLKLDVF